MLRVGAGRGPTLPEAPVLELGAATSPGISRTMHTEMQLTYLRVAQDNEEKSWSMKDYGRSRR